MAQLTNVDRNNGFVNPPPLPWMSEVSIAVHLAILGLMGEGRRQADRQNSGEFRKFENSL